MKPRIEISHFELPHPQAYIDPKDEQPKVGGTPGTVQVRLADNHGIWEASTNIRDGIKQLLRACKAAGLPFFVEDYEVVFTDTVRCNAFYADGREISPAYPSQGILPHKYVSASDDIAAYAADQCGRQAVTVEWAYEHLVDETLYVYMPDSMTDPWLTIDAGVDRNFKTDTGRLSDKFILCYGSAGEMSVAQGFRVFASKKAVEKASRA
jgi:hypothetical protein